MKLLVTLTMRCAKHPRYDPSNGEGAIRGGCTQCVNILAAYQRAVDVAEQMKILPGEPAVKVTRL